MKNEGYGDIYRQLFVKVTLIIIRGKISVYKLTYVKYAGITH